MKAAADIHETAPVCPVSGLTIIRRPEWTDVSFEGGYSTSFYVISPDILVVQAVGKANVQDLVEAKALYNDVVSECFGEARPYIQVQDYSRLKGFSTQARKRFVAHLSVTT